MKMENVHLVNCMKNKFKIAILCYIYSRTIAGDCKVKPYCLVITDILVLTQFGSLVADNDSNIYH